MFGKDQVVVDLDVEDAALAADELGVDAETVLDFSRETRGGGLVVSNYAVRDADVHGAMLHILPGANKSVAVSC